ncbi:MAG: trigger factor [Candidatus Gracilibacteria bacterium]
MDINLEKLEKSEVKLLIKLSAEEMEGYRKTSAEELQDKVNVPGFRKGHIPYEVLIEHIGEQAFLGQVLDIAIGDAYSKAVKEKDLHPVDYPRVNILTHDPLEFEATIPLMPEVKFKKDVKTITVVRQKPAVDEKDVKTVITNFLERFKKWTDVDRPAKKGDRVELDFEGFDETGVPLEGTASKNHPVILGSNSLIPGFEDEVAGMKKDEEKDFNIVFPKDYHSKPFQNKKVKFHIKLNRIEEGSEREASDEFAKEISGDQNKTMKDLEKEIEAELMHQKEHDEMARLENEFLKELIAHTEAEVPDSLIEREIDFLVNKLKEDLEKHKKTLEEYEEELKKEGKNLRDELKKPAFEQVLMRLGIEKLYELENPEVLEEEIEEEINHVLGHYPEQYKEVAKKNYEEGSEGRAYVKNNLRLKKIVKAHTKD